MRTLITASGAILTYSVPAFLPSRVVNVRLMTWNRTSASIAWSPSYTIDDYTIGYEVTVATALCCICPDAFVLRTL